MIGVATKTYDIDGARLFVTDRAADAANRRGSRRQSRVATLNNDVSIYDTGYCHGDRDITLREPQASEESIAFAAYICETYSLVIVTMSDGAYEATPGTYEVSEDGELTLFFKVKQKLSG